MNRLRIFMVVIALLSMTSCNNNGSKANCYPNQEGAEVLSSPEEFNPFEAFIEHFSETASFAYANVGSHKALLVSHETFGNNVNDDVEAIAASIFVLDSKGKIMALGSIRSQGTLYPVSILDGKLMVAGHQFVRIYGIRGDEPELVLDSFKEGDGPDLEDMYKTFEKSTPIKFKFRKHMADK